MAITRTLAELAQFVGARVIGDGRLVIDKVAPIDEAGPGDISFLSNARYQRFLNKCEASAVIVGPGVIKAGSESTGKAYLETANPYVAFAKILQLFARDPQLNREISPAAHIDATARVAESVTIFPQAFVSQRVTIGKGTVLYPGVFLGEDAQVGEECVLHPNVVVYRGCTIGNRVILHGGVVIGSDGFGYAGQGRERIKIPQTGIVVVEDDVEIGANSTVDRATLGRTVIGRGAKIDNLVQIAHNVTIGENSVLAAQVGIAGSTRIGKDVTLAGQVGVAHHQEIGDGAIIGPKTGVARSVAPGAVLSGWVEAAPHKQWLKAMMLLPRLPKLWSTVRNLEKKLSQLLKEDEKEL